FFETACQRFRFVRYRAGPEFQPSMRLWKTLPPLDLFYKFFQRVFERSVLNSISLVHFNIRPCKWRNDRRVERVEGVQRRYVIFFICGRGNRRVVLENAPMCSRLFEFAKHAGIRRFDVSSAVEDIEYSDPRRGDSW